MKEPWWKRATIYQIYPKSFYDSTETGSVIFKELFENLTI